MRRRFQPWAVARRCGPAVVALWSLAVTQPLLDLFGRNPEFFVANDLSRLEIVAFALVLALAGPVLLVAVQVVADAIGPRVGGVVRHAEVFLLGTALAFVVQAQFDVEDAAIAVAVALFGGAVVAYLEATQGLVRTGLRYLALTPVLFLAGFLFFSPAADLLRGGGTGDVEAGVVNDPAPIVVLSMDEFPVASLLRPDGTINAQRFPNFARLAERASWYRDATSSSPVTQQSVPATLTGLLPGNSELPTAQDHPRSIFTLLGDAYDQHVSEQMTDVCPEDICPDEGGRFDLDRLRTASSDAAVVYAHLAMPPSVQEHLPTVDRSWGAFLDDATTATGGPSVADGGTSASDPNRVTSGESDPSCPDAELWCGAPRLSELADSIAAEAGGDRPDLWLYHVTVPHVPWIRSPSGHQYAPRNLDIPGSTIEGEWAEDEPYLVRQSLQRHLLQLGDVDRLLGRVMDELDRTGTWDEALLVVTADHGISFTPGASLRAPTPATMHEIYNVPLFVKLPGQAEGGARDENALTVDVLPTIVDALDIDTDWEFDGESLLGDDHRPDKPVVFNGTRSVVPPGVEGVLELARRNAELLPYRQDWLGVVAAGPYGSLVGRPVDELDASAALGPDWGLDEAATLADWDPDGSDMAPLLVHGHLDVAAGVPTDALLAVNGTVAGVVGGLSVDGSTARFSSLLAEELLRPGANEVTLLVPVSPGARSFQTVPLSG